MHDFVEENIKIRDANEFEHDCDWCDDDDESGGARRAVTTEQKVTWHAADHAIIECTTFTVIKLPADNNSTFNRPASDSDGSGHK